MPYYEIHQALTQSIIDLALEVPLAHENRNFNYDNNTSYTTDTAGYSIGDTVITLITGTGEIYDGSNVSFGDDPNYYNVVSGTSAPGAITISAPGLVEEITAEATSTVGHIEQFIDITTIPATTEVLSKDSIDEELGIYQLSVYTKSGIGIKKAYELADTLEAFYKHGVTLTKDTQIVFIEVTSRNAGRNIGSWFIIDLSIDYKADLLR